MEEEKETEESEITEKDKRKPKKKKEKKDNFFRKHKKLFIFLIILAAGIAALTIFLVVRQKNKAEKTTETTAKIERRDIVNSISGTGKIVSQNSTDVSAPSDFGLPVSTVSVSVGDIVSEGQEICSLDASTYEDEITELNSQIASLQADKKEKHASYNQNKQNLENMQNSGTSVTEEDVALAQQVYDDAQNVLNEKQQQLNNYVAKQAANTSGNGDAAAGSQAGAGENANGGQAGASGNAAAQLQNLSGAASAITQAQQNLSGAANNLQSAGNGAAGAVQSAQTDATVLALTQDIASLQADLEVKKNDLDAKKAAYEALSNAELYMSGLTEDSLASYDKSVNAAISAIKKQISSLQERVDSAVMTAQSSGTVTEVNVAPGQTYLGGTAVLVEDTDHFMVEATVSEYDIPDIEMNMPAVVKTDATRNDELNGTVTFISPKADAAQNSLFDMSSMVSNSSFSSLSSLTSTSSSDDATFTIRITLDDENPRLRLGMNASISIVTTKSENTLTVPYEAIQTDEDGSNYILVQKTKKDDRGKKTTYAKKVPVTTGLEGNYYTEIITDGAKEGDTVIIPDDDSDNSVNELLDMMGSDAGL